MRQALEAQGVKAESLTGWSDEFRIGLHGRTRRVLAPRGVKVRQRVQMERDWYDLALTVDGREGRLAWDWVASTRANDLAPAVSRWREEGFEALVWDNAKSHRASNVVGTGIALVHQPPHSPELNPAERVGEAIRAATEGTVYRTIWKKMAAVERFLHGLAADPERIKSLAGWEWIAHERERLPHRGASGTPADPSGHADGRGPPLSLRV